MKQLLRNENVHQLLIILILSGLSGCASHQDADDQIHYDNDTKAVLFIIGLAIIIMVIVCRRLLYPYRKFAERNFINHPDDLQFNDNFIQSVSEAIESKDVQLSHDIYAPFLRKRTLIFACANNKKKYVDFQLKGMSKIYIQNHSQNTEFNIFLYPSMLDFIKTFDVAERRQNNQKVEEEKKLLLENLDPDSMLSFKKI